MILVDRKEKPNKRDKMELVSLIRSNRVPCEKDDLLYGDFAFEGFGPQGKCMVGIERKTLHDVLQCIDTSRMAGHQFVGMRKMYPTVPPFLIVEGLWRPHDPDGHLMEGFERGREIAWTFCKPGGRGVMYSKLRRYLFSVQMSGVVVLYTRNMRHTAFDMCELYHWFQKPWDKHTAMLSTHQELLPSLAVKPNVTRKWARSLDSIGDAKSELAAKVFASPYALAVADESAWMRIPGIGAPTARRIVKSIRGWK
jgi:ERCC4-type nuclease